MQYTYQTPEGPFVKQTSNKFYQNPPLWTDECSGIHFQHSKRFERKVRLDMGYDIKAVIKNSPADKAGLKEGDVIVSVGHRCITSVNSWIAAMRDVPHAWVAVKFKRNGITKSINVKFGARRGSDNKTYGYLGVVRKQDSANRIKAKRQEKLSKRIKVTERKPEPGYVGTTRSKSIKDISVDKKGKTAAEAGNLKQNLSASPSDENHFMKQAREEMAGALALMEDMQGVEALQEAKKLKEKLRTENLRALARANEIVHSSLNAMKARNDAEFSGALDRSIDRLTPKKRWRLPRLPRVSISLPRPTVRGTIRKAWVATKVASVAAVCSGAVYGGYIAYLSYF